MAKEMLLKHDAEFCSRPPLIVGEYVGLDYNGISFAPADARFKLVRKIINSELLSASRLSVSCAIREEEVAAVVQQAWPTESSSKTGLK